MLELLLCLVVGVTDGDSLTVRCGMPDSYQQIKLRLAEIDAPEKRQPFGQASKAHLSALCFQEQATIRPQTTDRYGRLVARVECAGSDASYAQVHAGMAWAFTRYLTDIRVAQAEQLARSKRLGLWSDVAPIPPWDWRRSRRRLE